ncbi:MAG: hypothetical protein U1C04_25965 [Hydrogenophaga sp.]|uniref:hypothetical protein n=1 Tax=Hydrogenophaga sp. TaxID=1904254 RepID=UPI002ABABF2F|nr:hypothetical protein [Hydrogenophaga sp.]MDZ4284191.1 hypothetical protein [Hydrogenophaga sp.]
MATTKPRITISLTPRQHQVIKVMSDSSGKSMSAFIGEMLEAALPTLERMAVTLQKIKQAQDQERSKFIESMDDAQSALEPYVLDTIGQFDLFLGKIERAVDGEGVPAAGGEVSAAIAAPGPRTNRGVTPNSKKPSPPLSPKASSRFSKSKVFQKPEGCTCTYTDHERMENRACPVHKGRGV